jgi:hypothetical protein
MNHLPFTIIIIFISHIFLVTATQQSPTFEYIYRETTANKNETSWDEILKNENLLFYCGNNDCAACNETVINCNDLRLNSIIIPINYTRTLEQLTLTGNNFGPLNDTIFTDQMPKLARLDLSNNNITGLNSNHVFENLPVLTELVLDENPILFETEEQFNSLSELSGTLKTLSLNRKSEFKQNKTPLKYREIIRLLTTSGLLNLEDLQLRGLGYERPLVGVKKRDGMNFLCLLPKLKRLDLAGSMLQDFDLNISCVHGSHDANITRINLNSNQISTLTASFVNKLRFLKTRNANFSILLTNNRFKCDCTLYAFYLFLRSDSSVIERRDELTCTHHDSLHVTLDRRIVDSGLDKHCNGGGGASSSTSSFFTG